MSRVRGSPFTEQVVGVMLADLRFQVVTVEECFIPVTEDALSGHEQTLHVYGQTGPRVPVLAFKRVIEG